MGVGEEGGIVGGRINLKRVKKNPVYSGIHMSTISASMRLRQGVLEASLALETLCQNNSSVSGTLSQRDGVFYLF